MNPHLPPYSDYKPTGVEWLGVVPAHWEVTATKRHYAIQLGKMLQSVPKRPDDVEVPYLKALHVQWFDVLTWNVPTMWASRNETRQFGIEPGDLLVCEGGEGGRCAILHKKIDNCIIQNALHRVRPREQSLNAFLQYVMSTIAAIGWFDALNDKATIAHFTKEKFDALKIPLPPLPEQRAIVRYLDHVDRRIQRYIDTKEKLIALLQEARQATIQRAVTRGLNPDMPLKPSGVDWLGDVPAHWDVRRLKTLCTMKSGDWIDAVSIETEGEIPVYGGNGLRGFTSNYNQDGAFALIGRQGALCGNVHIARGKFWATEHAVVTTLDSGHDVVWFGAILTAMDLNQYSIAAAQPGLSVERILNLHLPVPPSAEQERIATHLDRATAAIDAAIDTARRQADLMREYRASLIAHVVTGKLDVRAAAEHLPPEYPEQKLASN